MVVIIIITRQLKQEKKILTKNSNMALKNIDSRTIQLKVGRDILNFLIQQEVGTTKTKEINHAIHYSRVDMSRVKTNSPRKYKKKLNSSNSYNLGKKVQSYQTKYPWISNPPKKREKKVRKIYTIRGIIRLNKYNM